MPTREFPTASNRTASNLFVVLNSFLRAEEAFAAEASEGEQDVSLLCVVQGTKLVAAQRAGNNSVLRCSQSGEVISWSIWI